jgi:hypothetical protein
MHTKTSLGAWRTSFLATLGLYPLHALVACSSSDSNENSGTNPVADSSVSNGGSSTGGAGGKMGTGASTTSSGGGGTSGTGGSSVTGGSSGVGGSATGGTDGGTHGTACKNPQPVMVNGKDTGFVVCDNGAFHRVAKKECPTELPRTDTCGPGPVGDAAIATGSCYSDGDCKDQPNGYCMAAVGGILACFCNYGCRTDADCGAGSICGCASPVGVCIPAANCTVDSDCGAGNLCLSTSDGGCGKVFACQTKDDSCASDADCAGPCASDAGCIAQMCSFVPAVPEAGTDAGNGGTHQCTPIRPCATGRPFLVGGAARVAAVARRGDWASALAPCLDGLDADDRDALGRHYTEVALMEHASIAAFARFALELLALGAPPELLAETHAAMADETVHARDAFALASAYAGRAVGPGALDVDCALTGRDPVDVVKTAILEGCVGETVAAIEAAEALAHARDPAVRAALERVAVDEARHAALAWRFVRWVLETGTPALRRSTEQALSTVVSSELTASNGTSARARPEPARLLAHGAIDRATRQELRRRVLVEIVEPCIMELLRAVRPAESSEAVAA